MNSGSMAQTASTGVTITTAIISTAPIAAVCDEAAILSSTAPAMPLARSTSRLLLRCRCGIAMRKAGAPARRSLRSGANVESDAGKTLRELRRKTCE